MYFGPDGTAFDNCSHLTFSWPLELGSTYWIIFNWKNYDTKL